MARRLTSAELVGRAQEVERFSAALTAAMAGEPGHLLVGGEAGVGKTRLLAAFAARAQAAGARVVAGGCVNMGDTGLPFAPYTEILRSLISEDGVAQVAALAGRAADDLARLVPALVSEAVPPDQELLAQTRMYEAILGLLRRYAERTPLAVYIEDLHWADAGTLAATSFLLRNVTDEPVVIVATYREDEVVRTHPLRAWLAEALRVDGVDRMVLERLDADEVSELVANITGESPDLAQAADLARRSDGNPYFIEELIARGTDSGRGVPETIRDVLLSRVDSVSEDGRWLINVAAVGGRATDVDVLLAVAADDTRATTALRELIDAGLLVRSSGAGDETYGFRHALLQEAVYGALLPHERRALHRAFADVLAGEQGQASDPRRVVELAYHWRQAGDARALAGSMAAGDAAMASFSFDVALREYQHALELWDAASAETDALDRDHVRLLAQAGRAALQAGEIRASETATRAAVAEVEGRGDPERTTELTVQLGRVLWVAGHYQASLDTYERAYREAPEPPSIARILATSGLGQASMLFGRYERAVELCGQAVELAAAQGRRDLEGHAKNSLGTSLAAIGRTAEGLAVLDESLAIALELGLPDDIGRAHVNRGDVLAYGGDPAAALASTLEGLEIAEAWGAKASYGVYLRMHAVRFGFESGAWDMAARMLEEADRRAAPVIGARLYRGEYVLAYLVARGDPGAHATWDEVRLIMSESPAFSDAAYPYAAAIQLATFEDRLEDAAALIQQAIDFVGPADLGRILADLAVAASWPTAELGLRARADGDVERTAAAATEMDRLAELVDRVDEAMGRPADTLGTLLQLDREQVAAERARMGGSADVDAWRTVADGWDELGYRYQALYARWRAGEAAGEAGEREAATRLLQTAHAAAEGLGARPLAEQIERSARRLKVRLGPGVARDAGPDDGVAYGLTRRELEVLTLVAAGRTNRQIAEELFISESTAGVHVSNLMGKLGVSTRTEAARIALDESLVKA